MKKVFLLLMLISAVFFFNSCEEEENESCTGNSTADMLVGTWEVNYQDLRYTNGDIHSCYNYCDTYNSLCDDGECFTYTSNCDGTYTYSTGEDGTWSYNPQTESITTIGEMGVFTGSIDVINSNQLITFTNVVLVDQESGAQIDLVVQSAYTRIN